MAGLVRSMVELLDSMKAPMILCFTACLGGLTLLTPAVTFAESASSSRSSQEVRNLDDLIGGEALWDMTPETFEAKFKDRRFQWLSQAKDQARFFGNYGLWDGQVRVAEAIVEFQNGKFNRVNLTLFDRGDSSAADYKSRKDFEKAVDDLKGAVTSHLGVQPRERGRDATSAVKAQGWLWAKPPAMYLLEWSFQKENIAMKQDFRAEFIRLRVAQVPKQQGLLAGNESTAGNQPVLKASLAGNVTHEENGDVYIKNVPMVDQGPKGYCAVATAERVFRYYGIAVDQHEMAQVANTHEGGGTSPTAMFTALTALEGRLHVKVRAITKWDYGEFSRMIDAYNREAKHDKKTEVKLTGRAVVDIGEIYGEFDPEALKQALTAKNKANYNKFQRTVSTYVDHGVPLMWGVELGLYKEAEIPQNLGGHMRLIIGYNNKTNEILYSDSWGEAHALKHMPFDNAFSMTTGLYYMEPLK